MICDTNWILPCSGLYFTFFVISYTCLNFDSSEMISTLIYTNK